jgi:hypothetical protein
VDLAILPKAPNDVISTGYMIFIIYTSARREIKYVFSGLII